MTVEKIKSFKITRIVVCLLAFIFVLILILEFPNIIGKF